MSSTVDSSVLRTAVNAYKSTGLRRDELPNDPIDLFRTWMDDALRPDPATGRSTVSAPDAVAVSTTAADGVPSSRTVLLKGLDDTGFIFFTSYNSRKSREIEATPFAALNFHWRELNRQIRVVGRAQKVTRAESEAYFATRPRASQVGTWASAQSQSVGENELAEAMAAAEARWEGKQVECPEQCGAWRVVPL